MPVRIFAALLVCISLAAATARAEEVECLTTEWKLLGANHKVCVYAFDDPDISCVTCYLSQAKTGGIKGSVGLAEDPSEFSLECVQTCPTTLPDKLPRTKKVFSEGTSLVFKDTEITRIYDPKRKSLVYLAISRKIISGSPKNALSTVVIK
ncbi:MAG: CreA family protein [Acidobacteriota bacterium]